VIFWKILVKILNSVMAAVVPWAGNRAERSPARSLNSELFMDWHTIARVMCVCGLLAAAVSPARAQGYALEGGEYKIGGTLPGEQMYPAASIRTTGGYIVWQDNITDGSGTGISARKLDSSLSSAFSPFRVNQEGAEQQERPSVTMLNDGGAAFVWESGKQGFQHIYARFLTGAGTWETGDVMVNAPTNVFQLESTATTLTNGNVVVAWSTFNQVSGSSLRDVYFQILTPAGAKTGEEVLVNQATTFNQRSAALAPLSDGRFVVVWVSEQQRFENSVDIYARVYSATGVPVGSEFLVNSTTNVCATPSVARAPDGGFAVAWVQRDLQSPGSKWDVYMRPFSANGFGGVARRVNTQLQGDQYTPRISAMGTDYLMVWTSLGQDGSNEGVYGQFLRGDGTPAGGEFRVNSTVISQQMHPAVASDGVERFLTVWTSFVGGTGSFDLYAQRYVNTSAPLPPPGSPMVTVLSSNSLSISWPAVQGISVLHYEVYADGAVAATAVTSNTYWNATGLAPASTHSYRLAYVVADGRRSPLSGATANTTYSAGATWGGIPQEWMSTYFGPDIFTWPSPYLDTDGDGASNKDEFLAGTNPTDALSVLKVRLQQTVQGLFLDWNTQTGLMYQVQEATGVNGPWSDLGGPRFAAGSVDSLFLSGNSAGFYRIVRLR
jgi:hypothetical protein